MVSPELYGGQEPRPCQALIVTAGTKKISGGPVGPTSHWIGPWVKKVSRTTAMAVAWRASGVRVIFLESPSSALRRSPIIF